MYRIPFVLASVFEKIHKNLHKKGVSSQRLVIQTANKETPVFYFPSDRSALRNRSVIEVPFPGRLLA